MIRSPHGAGVRGEPGTERVGTAERFALLLLVGGALFPLVTGIVNIQYYYAWPFSFYAAGGAAEMRRGRRAAAVSAVLVAVLAGSGCAGGEQTPSGAGDATTTGAEPGTSPILTATPAGDVRLLPTGAPEGIAVDPASGVIAIALRDPDRLALVDPATEQVRTAPMPGAARHLVLSRPGELLVPAEDVDLLIEVALPQGAIIRSVPVGRQPHDAAQQDGTVFVGAELDRGVGVVRDGRMIRTLPGPDRPDGVGTTAGRLAVADAAGDQLYVYDTTSLARVAVLPAGDGPSHVRALGAGLVAVTDTAGNAVLVYDLSGRPRQVATVPVPGRPYGLATDPARGRVFVTLADTNQVIALRRAPDGSVRTVGVLPTVRQPNSVAYAPASDTVLVAGTTRSELQTIPAAAFEAG